MATPLWQLPEGNLAESDDNSSWQAALSNYSSVLEKKAAESKGKKSKNQNDLLKLDKWYQEDLPRAIQSRSKPHLTHAELCKLMKWKLTRGKFRPRLTELVKQNTPEVVKKTTQIAIQQLPNLEAAIKTLSQLKAVGPATASAVLCAAAPSQVPFMADESVLSFPDLGKLEYNIRHYISYAEKIQEKVQSLNANDTENRVWTCHEVEKALWTYHLAKKYGFSLVSCTAHQTDSKQDVTPPPPTKRKDTPSPSLPPAKRKKR